MYKIAFKQANKKLQTLYTKEEPMYFLQLLAFADIEYLLIEKVDENDGIIKYNDYTGTIVRLPMTGVHFPEGYVVELDDNRSGWSGTRERDGIDCKGGWFATEKNLELINEAILQANKWYHTTDFTVDELSALLPSGTKVEVEAEVLYNNIDTTPPTKTKRAVVENVVPSAIEQQTFIATTNNSFYKEWFKIVQED